MTATLDIAQAPLAFDPVVDVTTEPHRRFDDIEALMFATGGFQLPVKHLFAHGVYAREITIPAGVMLAGKIHRTEHFVIVLNGLIKTWCEAEGLRVIDARRGPVVFIAQPGTRRLGVAIEDSTWISFHPDPTDCRDPDLLETSLIQPHKVADELIQHFRDLLQTEATHAPAPESID